MCVCACMGGHSQWVNATHNLYLDAMADAGLIGSIYWTDKPICIWEYTYKQICIMAKVLKLLVV